MSVSDKMIAATCMATRTRMAARSLSRSYDAALRPVDLKATQFAVLVAASLSGGRRTITDLADALGLDRSSLSRNLQPLERRGLIIVGPETLHRARHVDISAAGRSVLQQAVPLWERAQADLKARLGDDWAGMLRKLEQLAA